MTRHTQAIVLRQSVVSSIGKVLFCNMHVNQHQLEPLEGNNTSVFSINRIYKEFTEDSVKSWLTSDTNLVVALLRVLSMGVASA